MSIDQFQPEEVARIRKILQGLIATLRSRKPASGSGTLIPDEEYILESLTHPERGDVMVLMVRQPKSMELFLSNRRDASNPFVVMDKDSARRNPGRRPLNHDPSGLKEGEWGLFINSIQDRELLRVEVPVEAYSSHFGLGDSIRPAQTLAPDLESRPVHALAESERWLLFKRGLEPTDAGNKIERELFGFQVHYAKYKAAVREETVVLNPRKLKQNVGQMIRDIYPYNVRVILRRDFPLEHAQKIKDMETALKSLISEVRNRINNVTDEEYRSALQEAVAFMDKILESDPEFASFL
ncbi:MAG: hypothetical protein HS115_16700 [Spirochaetales bacterium]|nr:hypothetical protein [Spirochaetales bacterium]